MFHAFFFLFFFFFFFHFRWHISMDNTKLLFRFMNPQGVKAQFAELLAQAPALPRPPCGQTKSTGVRRCVRRTLRYNEVLRTSRGKGRIECHYRCCSEVLS
ncbi:hypothetical protein J3F83DRAFT_394882 [Trichoderma novae-zelandiae]